MSAGTTPEPGAAAGARPAVDPITVEAIGNALSSIVEEMGETLVRAAALVERDLAEGVISERIARDVYGSTDCA